ncbi:hypothetical protein BDW67DRAFT_161095 [Aspergillus spinulosporus]
MRVLAGIGHRPCCRVTTATHQWPSGRLRNGIIPQTSPPPLHHSTNKTTQHRLQIDSQVGGLWPGMPALFQEVGMAAYNANKFRLPVKARLCKDRLVFGGDLYG